MTEFNSLAGAMMAVDNTDAAYSIQNSLETILLNSDGSSNQKDKHRENISASLEYIITSWALIPDNRNDVMKLIDVLISKANIENEYIKSNKKEITIETFWKHICQNVAQYDRDPFKLPNGWLIEWKPRDRIDPLETYEGLGRSYYMRFKIFTEVDGYTHIYHKYYFELTDVKSWEKLNADDIKYIDLDDCNLSQFEPLFNWLIQHPHQDI